MLRKILLYLSQAGWARAIVTHFFLARRVARRFVAGEKMDDAIQVTHDLNKKGLLVTLDYLGESVQQVEDTEDVVNTYCQLLHRIQSEKLQASISLKLTHLGLDISEELCINNLRKILLVAGDIPVTIDMESSHYTDITLRIFRQMHTEFLNVGTVIQSALRRSREDMQQLAAEGARIRLCKGAYLEPETIAFPKKSDVDAHYIAIMDDFLQHVPPAYLDIATHDEAMITAALEIIDKYQVPQAGYEFQMLYGIRSNRQLELAKAGYKMRVYVPFGTAWYPYFMRRLAERPANLWFFVRSVVRG
ncbi:MAG: proline dehydrogenase [Phototrophicales bacterium]|nr:MAG: proline dehydrogenase [Phototrophicales bacterium]RMG75879.1 MAG: proline dehydrogenase [Chloroflexota bacterium]